MATGEKDVISHNFFLTIIVGEFIKTCYPRNAKINEICDARFQGQRTREDLESGTHEVWKSRMRENLESRTLEASGSRTRDGPES
jgi:hypothetical protein